MVQICGLKITLSIFVLYLALNEPPSETIGTAFPRVFALAVCIYCLNRSIFIFCVRITIVRQKFPCTCSPPARATPGPISNQTPHVLCLSANYQNHKHCSIWYLLCAVNIPFLDKFTFSAIFILLYAWKPNTNCTNDTIMLGPSQNFFHRLKNPKIVLYRYKMYGSTCGSLGELLVRQLDKVIKSRFSDN